MLGVLCFVGVYLIGALFTNFLLFYVFTKQNAAYDTELDSRQREDKFLGAILWPITLFVLIPSFKFFRFICWLITSGENWIADRIRPDPKNERREER